jgi:hypothetical protein
MLSHDDADAITALATVLLVFVTGGLVWMAYRQIVTSRAQLRAYVGVVTADIHGVVVNGIPKAHIAFRNYGKTPAYKFKILAAMGMAPSFDTLPPPTGDPHGILGVLAPTADFHWFMDAPQQLNAQAFGFLTSGQLTLFVYGQVQYQDAFGNPRFMKFRTVVGGAAGVQSAQLASCPEGNEAN